MAQREAALAQARIDLARTRITSPVDGIVVKRAIEKGQTVAASLQSPELFVIAQNLSDMQVEASVDESDVGRIRTGQRATFTVDAFPGQTFEGSVRQVRKAAQTIANVVTYVAVVGFSNAGGRLLPGMTANVRVVTDQRESVLKVPNAALRMRIAGVEPPAAAASGAAAPGVAGAASTATSGAGGWSFFSQAYAQAAGGQGGGLAAQRERLTSALQLDAEQQAKLDAIGAEMRPKFGAMRDMSEAERAAARPKLLAEMQQRISAMLKPEQRSQYDQMIKAAAAAAQGTGAAPADGNRRVAADTRPGNNAAVSAAPAAGASSAVARPSSPTAAAAAGTAAAPAGGGAAGGGGGPLGEFRNRLVSELQLTPDQIGRVDGMFADTRPRFQTLRDIAAEERPKARDRIMADLRARIGELLTPEQKTKYAALLAEAGSRTTTRGRLYVLGEDGKPRAINVRLGITDGSSTELLIAPSGPNAADLKEGALVIVGVQGPGASAAGGAARAPSGPRLPF